MALGAFVRLGFFDSDSDSDSDKEEDFVHVLKSHKVGTVAYKVPYLVELVGLIAHLSCWVLTRDDVGQSVLVVSSVEVWIIILTSTYLGTHRWS